jgi:hypothetical protein
MAAIEDINRFRQMRSVGAYLGLTTRRYELWLRTHDPLRQEAISATAPQMPR